jgi:Cu/Ag efflux protein CusF
MNGRDPHPDHRGTTLATSTKMFNLERKRMVTSFALVAVLATLPVVGFAGAQDQAGKTVTKQNKIEATATIKAIDPATRSVTLRMENGDEDTFTVSPDVTRFNQLKVGDTIKAAYYESLVFQVRQPGAPAPTSGTTVGGGRLSSVPGGALGAQQTTTVTVKAVDMTVPSITVVTEDGRTLTRKIAEKQNLEGVKAGDKIDITYIQAVVVSAEAGKQ